MGVSNCVDLATHLSRCPSGETFEFSQKALRSPMALPWQVWGKEECGPCVWILLDRSPGAASLHTLWFFRWDIGIDRAVEQTGIDLFHSRLHFRRHLIIKIMEGSIGDVTQIVATWEAPIPCTF